MRRPSAVRGVRRLHARPFLVGIQALALSTAGLIGLLQPAPVAAVVTDGAILFGSHDPFAGCGEVALGNPADATFRAILSWKTADPFWCGPQEVEISPDGSKVLYVENTGNAYTVRVADIDGANDHLLQADFGDGLVDLVDSEWFDFDWAMVGSTEYLYMTWYQDTTELPGPLGCSTDAGCLYRMKVSDGTMELLGDYLSTSSVSPNGEWMAYVTWDEAAQLNQLTIGRPDATDSVKYGEGYSVAWSPDGSKIVYGGGDWVGSSAWGIGVADVSYASGRPVPGDGTLLFADAYSATWSPSGASIAYVLYNNPETPAVADPCTYCLMVADTATWTPVSQHGAGKMAQEVDSVFSPVWTSVSLTVSPLTEVDPPIVTGSTVPGTGTLAITTPATWSGTHAYLLYGWLLCDETGGSCERIPWASSSSQPVSGDWIGKTLRAQVIAVDADGDHSLPSISAASGVIQDTVAPTITAPGISPSTTVSPGIPLTITATASDNYRMSTVDLSVTGPNSYVRSYPVFAVDGTFDEASESVTATVAAPLTSGTYSVCVAAWDVSGYHSTTECTSFVVSGTRNMDATLEYTGDTSLPKSSVVVVEARLKNGSNTGITGAPITFKLGKSSCSTTTDSLGYGSCELTTPAKAGNATVVVTYDGSGDFVRARLRYSVTIY